MGIVNNYNRQKSMIKLGITLEANDISLLLFDSYCIIESELEIMQTKELDKESKKWKKSR